MNTIHKIIMALCAVGALTSNHDVQAAALPVVAVSNGKKIAVSILRQLGDTSLLISKTKLIVGAVATAIAAGTAVYVAKKPTQKPKMIDQETQTTELSLSAITYDFAPTTDKAKGSIATLKPDEAQNVVTLLTSINKDTNNTAAPLTSVSEAILTSMPTLDSLPPLASQVTGQNINGGSFDDKHNS